MIDWNAVEALATSASVILTAVVLIYVIQQTRAAHRSADAATTELHATLDERRRAQAESVSGWIISVARRDEPYKSLFGGLGDGFGLVVHLSNGSHLPIWAVRYTVVNNETAETIVTGTESVVPPNQQPRLLIPPAVQRTAPTDVHDRAGHEAIARGLGLVIEFTDSRGNRWTRQEDGSLQEVAVSS
ncbi:MAG: hypothetical protein GY926_27455 [bacterium]|nr:hypothetical protein [bacterium]